LIAVRIPEELKAKLEQYAKADHRPLSNLVRLILIEWLEAQEEKHGRKPPPSKGKKD